jgi:hypothetical protein
MPATLSEYCPWCNKYTAITPAPLVAILFGNMVHPIDETIREATGNQWNGIPLYRRGESWMGKCNACEKPVLVIGIQSPRIFPTPQPLLVSDDIPEPMRSDLYEARLCQSIGAFNASVVMARRALQCAAVQQGATPGKKLWEQTQELLRSGAITKSMYEWTEAARWVGNHGAHDTEPDANGRQARDQRRNAGRRRRHAPPDGTVLRHPLRLTCDRERATREAK